jgi:toxin ParE1/3/4
MNRYMISPTASQNLDEITDYFLSRSIEAGERFTQEFDKKCQNLVNFPKIGRSYSELEPGLRGISLENYIILYQLIEDRLEIVRVVSGYRDLSSLLDRDKPSNFLPLATVFA